MSKTFHRPKVVTDDEMRRLFVQENWLPPLSMANRWGISKWSVYKYIKKGLVICVTDVMNRHYLLDPKQPKP